MQQNADRQRWLARAEKALDAGLELARRLGIPVAMVCVEDVPRFPAVVDRVPLAQSEGASPFEPTVNSATALAKSRGVVLEAEIVAGHPVPAIVEFIRRGGFDLLVVGYSGHSALLDGLIGSNADRLVALAPCKVMVVK